MQERLPVGCRQPLQEFLPQSVAAVVGLVESFLSQREVDWNKSAGQAVKTAALILQGAIQVIHELWFTIADFRLAVDPGVGKRIGWVLPLGIGLVQASQRQDDGARLSP